jgi:hypothetical protein
MDYSRDSSCIFYLRCISKITANGYGLAMWRYLKNRQPVTAAE